MNATPNLNLDRSFFLVISELDSGIIVQRECELDWDRITVLDMAREGQFDTVLAIIECNPVEESTRVIPQHLIDDEIEVEERTQRYSAARFPTCRDPNGEHRIGNFEAGTGSFGPFSGRAA